MLSHDNASSIVVLRTKRLSPQVLRVIRQMSESGMTPIRIGQLLRIGHGRVAAVLEQMGSTARIETVQIKRRSKLP